MEPFFSIVIPTKNRPTYLHDTIYSAINQSFKNIEVIVSDNFNDERTKEVVDLFSSDSRLKYFRTDREMNMIDHWEFATTKAIGQYVLVLADRKLLYQHSLKKIYKILLKYPEMNVCSFGVKVFNDIEKKMGWNVPSKRTQIFESSLLIENFLNENIFDASKTLDYYFPKTVNSIYRNDFAKKIREVGTFYFNNKGVSTPDFSSCFINWAFNNKVLYIGEPTILIQGEHISNGRNFGRGNYQNYLNSLKTEDLYKKVPTNLPFIYNLLINDFLEIKEKFGQNLINFNVNWENYFAVNYYEYHNKCESENLSQATIDSFHLTWEKALDTENELTKANIQKKIHIIVSEFNSNIKTKKLNNIIQHLVDFINHRFSKYSFVNKFTKHRFTNGLEAAGFKK